MESISILGLTFRVILVDDLKDADDDLDGEVDFNDHVIRIRSGQNATNSRESVFHEVTHCVLRLTGIAHLLNSYHPELEEVVCRALEHGLSQALVDNPQLREMFEG